MQPAKKYRNNRIFDAYQVVDLDISNDNERPLWVRQAQVDGILEFERRGGDVLNLFGAFDEWHGLRVGDWIIKSDYEEIEVHADSDFKREFEEIEEPINTGSVSERARLEGE